MSVLIPSMGATEYTTTGTAISTWNLPHPTTFNAGDLGIILVIHGTTLTVNTPSGWTILNAKVSAASGVSISTFYRIATSNSGGANVSMGFASGSGIFISNMTRFTGSKLDATSIESFGYNTATNSYSIGQNPGATTGGKVGVTWTGFYTSNQFGALTTSGTNWNALQNSGDPFLYGIGAHKPTGYAASTCYNDIGDNTASQLIAVRWLVRESVAVQPRSFFFGSNF